MQAFTHFALGAVVGASVIRLAPESSSPRARFGYAFGAATLAALSHVLMDDVATMTYHPPNALWGDPFWLAYHALAVVGALWIGWRFRRYWYALAGSVLPDVDWIVGRPLGLWASGAAHEHFRQLPGISAASEPLREIAPDLRLEPLAAGGELLLVGGLLAIAWWLDRRVDRAARSEPSSSSELSEPLGVSKVP